MGPVEVTYTQRIVRTETVEGYDAFAVDEDGGGNKGAKEEGGTQTTYEARRLQPIL